MPNGQVALRVPALLGSGGDGVEADIGEEDDGAAREDARPTVGHEGMPVVGLDEAGAGNDEDQDGGNLDQHHDVVGAGRLADAAHQDHGENHDDEKGGNVEAEVPSGWIEVVAGQVLEAGGQIGGRDPHERKMEAEPVHEVDDMGGKADADAHVAEGVFEDQVPADDPGNEFAEGGVGVRVSRTGDGYHGGQFGVTQPGEHADDGHQYERERQRGPRAGAAGHGRVVQEVVCQWRRTDGRHSELLAGHGRADDRKDARADDCADAESGERPGAERLFQRVLGLLRFADQLIDGLAGKQLAWQRSSPRPVSHGRLWMKAGPGELGTPMPQCT